MESHRLHKLIETDDTTDVKCQIGGAIVRMKIGAINGSLHEINVAPVSTKDMREEFWEDSFVRLQVADRVIWMDLEEIQALIKLLELAHDASIKNYSKIRS